MLMRLGWDIETAELAGLTGKIDDTKWVVHARKHNRISLTFDELKAKQGEKVSRELRRRGGKIIRINGAHNEYRAMGKLLYHYYDWHEFLSNNDGVAVISEPRPQGCNCYTPKKYHQQFHRTDAELFTKYLERRKKRPYRPRRHRARPSPNNQGILT